jgi:hypothetical protein
MALIPHPIDLNPIPPTPILDKFLQFVYSYKGLGTVSAYDIPELLNEQYNTIISICEFGVYIDTSAEDEKEKQEQGDLWFQSNEYISIKEKYGKKRKDKCNIVHAEIEDVLMIMTAGNDLDNYNSYQAMKFITEALVLVNYTDPILRTYYTPPSFEGEADLNFHPRRL